MDFFETINTRKTIRKYKPDMPDMDDVRKIIDAARVAPSATNSQNWQFIVIKNKNQPYVNKCKRSRAFRTKNAVIAAVFRSFFAFYRILKRWVKDGGFVL